MTTSVFIEWLKDGDVLLADGATGSNLQANGLPMGVAGETWVLENPDAIVQLHQKFIEAGSDIVLTCTFGGTALRLEQSGLAARMVEINRQAVALARQAVGKATVLVAGSIGPLGHLLKPLGPVEETDAIAAYRAQAQVLDESGVDLLLIETQFDLAEAKAAIRGVRSVSSLPLVCSFSFDRGTRTMMGVRPRQIGEQLPPLGVDVVGINCGRSLGENLESLRELVSVVDIPVWFKPNAGLPRLDGTGKPVYDLTPKAMGESAADWLAAGAKVVGGCCGTSPEHLYQIAAVVKTRK